MDREILAVKTRKDLYDFVRKNPGFHLRELSRALNLSITSRITTCGSSRSTS